MAYRDRQWYINAIELQKTVVEKLRVFLERHMANCDHSLAASTCDDLKTALLKLNELENQFADKEA